MALVLVTSSLVAFAGVGAAAPSDGEELEWDSESGELDGDVTLSYDADADALVVDYNVSSDAMLESASATIVEDGQDAYLDEATSEEHSDTLDLTYPSDSPGEYQVEVEVASSDIYSAERTVEVPETHDVTVTVLDEDDESVEDASVEVGSHSGMTDADGLLTLEGLTANTYEVVVDADGFETVETSETVDADNTDASYTLTADENGDEDDTHVVDVAVVETVENDEGDLVEEAVENATVTLAAETVETDADGLATFEAVEEGEYSDVTVSHSDYDANLSTSLTVDGDLSVTADFAALDDADDDGFTVESSDDGIFGGGGLPDMGDDSKTIVVGALAIILATSVIGVFAKIAGD